jgi:hypothetical protein
MVMIVPDLNTNTTDWEALLPAELDELTTGQVCIIFNALQDLMVDGQFSVIDDFYERTNPADLNMDALICVIRCCYMGRPHLTQWNSFVRRAIGIYGADELNMENFEGLVAE